MPAINVHGVRLAVHRFTGEIRSPAFRAWRRYRAVDRPDAVSRQIDGAIGMAFGWALTENMVHDEHGRIVNPKLRNYRIPAFADVPPSERGDHHRRADPWCPGRAKTFAGGSRVADRSRKTARTDSIHARIHVFGTVFLQPTLTMSAQPAALDAQAPAVAFKVQSAILF